MALHKLRKEIKNEEEQEYIWYVCIYTFFLGKLGINVGRECSVVMVMVITIRFMGCDNDTLQPFHHTTRSETGYYDP